MPGSQPRPGSLGPTGQTPTFPVITSHLCPIDGDILPAFSGRCQRSGEGNDSGPTEADGDRGRARSGEVAEDDGLETDAGVG